MRVAFSFCEEFHFFAKDELCLFVIKPHFFNALNVAFLVIDLVNNAVSSSYDLFEFKMIVQLPISTHEPYCFIVHLIILINRL